MIQFLKIINAYRSRILTDLKVSKRRVFWRKINSHNLTTLGYKTKDITLITVGKSSYGTLHVESYGNPDEKLVIGCYVSIAANVLFVLGGNHQINAFTTFPIKSQYYEKGAADDATSKGAVIVEDEVWIGNNVIIMSGVTLGKGCIIAAGSVVTKTVEPFTIVGGNPARFIKFRIPQELITKRMELHLENLNIESLSEEELNLFYQPLNHCILKQIELLQEKKT